MHFPVISPKTARIAGQLAEAVSRGSECGEFSRKRPIYDFLEVADLFLFAG